MPSPKIVVNITHATLKTLYGEVLQPYTGATVAFRQTGSALVFKDKHKLTQGNKATFLTGRGGRYVFPVRYEHHINK
jgi:hypothetical protein